MTEAVGGVITAITAVRAMCHLVWVEPPNPCAGPLYYSHRGVSPKNYQLIEHLIRKGRRQLALLEDASVTAFRL